MRIKKFFPSGGFGGQRAKVKLLPWKNCPAGDLNFYCKNSMSNYIYSYSILSGAEVI